MKSPIYTILLSGINAVGAQGCGCMFRVCHTSLKMGLLLHKTSFSLELLHHFGSNQNFFLLLFQDVAQVTAEV